MTKVVATFLCGRRSKEDDPWSLTEIMPEDSDTKHSSDVTCTEGQGMWLTVFMEEGAPLGAYQ